MSAQQRTLRLAPDAADAGGATLGRRSQAMLMGAWLSALLATAVALFLGEVMGMKPCQLCWYQRIAMFPLVMILGVAAWSEDRRGAIYALPLAVLGAAVALLHVLLTARVIPALWMPCDAQAPCSDQRLDFLGGIQLPWLSLAAFVLISCLLAGVLRVTARKEP